MRVLLVSTNRLEVPYPVYPLGLDHVAGALRPEHEVSILDLCGTPPSEEQAILADAVAGGRPDVVGISIRNVDNTDVTELRAFLGDVRRVVETLRALTDAPLVLGGAGYTLFPSDLLEAVGADYGIVGEGERLGELLAALREGRDVGALPFVAVPGRPAPPPTPWRGEARRAEPGLNPRLDFYLSRGGMLNLQTKRGCPFHCVYCTYPAIEGRKLRPLDPAEVGANARRLQDAGARFLFVTDSVFNASHRQSLEVARALRDAGVTVPWGAFFAPRRPPEGYYAALKELGLTHAEFGTDVLSPAMLASLGKSFSVEEALAAHRSAVDAGIQVAHFLLLGGPGETARTVDETLAACEHLDHAALFFFCGIRVYPKTPLWERVVAEGRLSPDQDLLEPFFYEPEAISLDGILDRATRHAAGRTHWVIGSGGEETARLLAAMHRRGRTGPLWEHLVP